MKCSFLFTRLVMSLQLMWSIFWENRVVHVPSPPRKLREWLPLYAKSLPPLRCSLNRAPAKLLWFWGPGSLMLGIEIWNGFFIIFFLQHVQYWDNVAHYHKFQMFSISVGLKWYTVVSVLIFVVVWFRVWYIFINFNSLKK